MEMGHTHVDELSVATVGAADCAGRTTLRIWTVWKGKGSGRGWHAKGRSWTTAHLASRPSNCTASFFRALIQPARGGCNGRRQQDGEMARDWALNPCKAAFAVQGDDIVDTSWARCMCQGMEMDFSRPSNFSFFFFFSPPKAGWSVSNRVFCTGQEDPVKTSSAPARSQGNPSFYPSPLPSRPQSRAERS